MSDATEPFEIRIDAERCMGSGNCLFWAPETFDLGDAGHAVVIDPTGSSEEKVRIAAQGCPVGAISLWRDGMEQSLEDKT